MKTRKPIRKVSLKRARINREYMKLRAGFLKEHPYCEWFMLENDAELRVAQNGFVFVPRSEDIHHKKGRGKYLLDTSTWMAVSRNAHRYLHDHPKESYEKGYLLPRNT